MAKLHELIAVEGDRSAVAEKIIDEAENTFTKRAELFMGQVRTLTMLDDERSGENMVDEKPLGTTVGDKADYVARRVIPYYDLLLQKALTNQLAKADLVVGGKTLMKDLPATYFLSMESQLKRLRRMYERIPTLNPSIRWEPDPDAGENVFRSEKPTVGMRTEKTVKSKILYDATKEHPAQIEKWNEDVPVGRIETVHFSGMITPADKASMLERIDTLVRACKKARQRCNDEKVADGALGKVLFEYIHNG